MKQKDLKIDFRYLTGNIACLSVDSISGESVHNDINNEEAIIIFNSLVGEKADCQTIKSLLKENEELNKQLEETEKCLKDMYHINIENDKELEKAKTQQQEFIKYLEDETKEVEKTIEMLSDTNSCRIQNLKYKGNTLKEILQKNKEIIGEK